MLGIELKLRFQRKLQWPFHSTPIRALGMKNSARPGIGRNLISHNSQFLFSFNNGWVFNNSIIPAWDLNEKCLYKKSRPRSPLSQRSTGSLAKCACALAFVFLLSINYKITIRRARKLDCSCGLPQPQTNTFFRQFLLPNFYLDTGKLRW